LKDQYKDCFLMNIKIKMPDFGTTSSDVTVLRWLVEPGQRIERGQPLMEIETDKSTIEVESIVSGVVREFLVDCGQSLEAGEVIVIIEVETSSPDSPPTDSPIAEEPPDTAHDQSKKSVNPAILRTPRGGTLFSRNRTQKSAKGNDSQTKSL
jgi:pyruvate/2-oxoglutarate dehydrogenase complex dihydrolipoamide acyltransferase (E2) component